MRKQAMETEVILATILGLAFVITALLIGARHIVERQSERDRIERRCRDLK
jgi:hypothetical protein